MQEKIDRLKVEGTSVNNTYYVTQKTVSSETVINKFLWVLFVVIIVSMIATFFVKDVPNAVFEFRKLAADGLWVMVSSYSAGELLKRIFRNKAKSTKEYKEAKKEAENALSSLTDEERDAAIDYCNWYEYNVYTKELHWLLARLNITEAEYLTKYALLNKQELKKVYPNLKKEEVKILCKIRKIKRIKYDPSFFISTIQLPTGLSPSQMYNANREDKVNTIVSLCLTLILSFCALSFAETLVLSFSLKVVLSAIVKMTVTVIFSGLKASFGWNLSMQTDLGHYAVVVKEVASLKNWYKRKIN